MTVQVHEWTEDEYVGQPGDIDIGLHGWFDFVDEAAAAVVEKRLEVFTHNDVDRSIEWVQR